MEYIQLCDILTWIGAKIFIIVLILIIDTMLRAWDEEEATEEDFFND